MEQKFLTRKQKRKMERRQKKEKMNEYYMKKFSKNKINQKNKFKKIQNFASQKIKIIIIIQIKPKKKISQRKINLKKIYYLMMKKLI